MGENEEMVTDESSAPVEQEETAEDVSLESSAQEETPSGEADAGTEETEGDADIDSESEVEAYKASTRFKAGVYNKETREFEQKEYDIDPRFHGVMKDAESEKLVRELHEKAFGIEGIKDRLVETRSYAQELSEENRAIKTSIDDLRTTYQSAVKTGNYHKLDGFFQKLQIPQDVVMQYALAKVQLNEMDPTQRQAILGQLEAEKRAEDEARQRSSFQEQMAEQASQMKQIQLDSVLARTDMSSVAEAFDARVGRPGAFRQACVQAGQLAWFQDKKDLTPEQAAQAVIQNYGLSASQGSPEVRTTPGSPQAPAKKVIQRQAATIPNVQGRSASPLQGKPKSMEQLLKYRKEQHGF